MISICETQQLLYVQYLHFTCLLTQTTMQCCGCICQYVLLLWRDEAAAHYWNMKVSQVGPAFLF